MFSKRQRLSTRRFKEKVEFEGEVEGSIINGGKSGEDWIVIVDEYSRVSRGSQVLEGAQILGGHVSRQTIVSGTAVVSGTVNRGGTISSGNH